MKKNPVRLCVAWMLVFTCVAVGAAQEDFNGPDADIKNLIQTLKAPAASPVPKPGKPVAAAPRAQAPKEWTILVYMNGKNSLNSAVYSDLNEMEQVGSSDQINIIAAVAKTRTRPGPGDTQLPADFEGEKIFYIMKDADSGRITSPVLQSYADVDMGSWKNLANIAGWAKSRYPAKRYMLIVWNHGSGWKSFGKTRGRDFSTQGISYDDKTGNHITTAQMKDVLAQIGGVDILASDACLMQMASVDYEIKDYAQIIVGSEETEPGAGYPYNVFLKQLIAKPSATAVDLAGWLVRAYVQSYPFRISPTQSAVSARALPDLNRLATRWSGLVMTAGDKNAVRNALKSCQTYYYKDYKDLYDFVRLVSAGAKSADIKEAGAALMNFISGSVVLANGAKLPGSHGIAVYLPDKAYDASYDLLAWARDGGWGEFVKWYLK